MELLIENNPDTESRLPYLLRLPRGGGLVFRTSGTWPRTTALYCHPVPAQDGPTVPDIAELRAAQAAHAELKLARG